MTSLPDHPGTPFLIVGHRGLPRRVPENTAESFRAALDAGADGIETDLRLLMDGVAVLYHDSSVGEVDVETLTSAELAGIAGEVEQLLALEELLVARRPFTVLEIKRPGWEGDVSNFASRLENVVVASFDHRVIRHIRREHPGLVLGVTAAAYLFDAGQYCQALGASWFFPEHHFVDSTLVDDCHSRGVRVMPWTANRPDQWRELRAAGCDGVITDVADLAVQWRAQDGPV